MLIVEFARRGSGWTVPQGRGHRSLPTSTAAHRHDSLAFTLGIVPLVIAKGASSETQNAIGTGLFGGMISATVLAVLFVPVFYVLVASLRRR